MNEKVKIIERIRKLYNEKIYNTNLCASDLGFYYYSEGLKEQREIYRKIAREWRRYDCLIEIEKENEDD